jgi:hypothetical protein
MEHFEQPGDEVIFARLLKNAPASAPQGGTPRRQADAS